MKKRITCFLLTFVMIFTSLPVSATESCQHEWSEWTVNKEPTCVDNGEEIRYCYNCDEEESRVLEATGKHDWDDWEVETSPTIYKEGIKSRFCYDCDATQTKKIPKLKPYAKISKKSLKLYVGSSHKLKASYAKGDSVKKWSSSKGSVASVSSKGVVKAKKTGTATITATLKSGKKASCKVTVIAKKKKQHTHKSTVYWTPNGSVYHSTPNCPTLSRSRTIRSGSISSCPKSRACKVCF